MVCVCVGLTQISYRDSNSVVHLKVSNRLDYTANTIN